MSVSSIRKTVSGVLNAMPDIFELQPSPNYQKLYSHSAAELTEKANAISDRQMCKAFKMADVRLKNAGKR